MDQRVNSVQLGSRIVHWTGRKYTRRGSAHTYTHTHTHTYIHTYIHSVHTPIHTYIHTYIRTYVHTYIFFESTNRCIYSQLSSAKYNIWFLLGKFLCTLICNNRLHSCRLKGKQLMDNKHQTHRKNRKKKKNNNIIYKYI